MVINPIIVGGGVEKTYITIEYLIINPTTGEETIISRDYPWGVDVTMPTDIAADVPAIPEECPALKFAGWNCSDIEEAGHDYGVGALYETADGKIHMFCYVADNEVVTLAFSTAVSTLARYEINWGDGTTSTPTATSPHTYTTGGFYDITIDYLDKPYGQAILILGGSSLNLLNGGATTTGNGTGTIYKIFTGNFRVQCSTGGFKQIKTLHQIVLNNNFLNINSSSSAFGGIVGTSITRLVLPQVMTAFTGWNVTNGAQIFFSDRLTLIQGGSNASYFTNLTGHDGQLIFPDSIKTIGNQTCQPFSVSEIVLSPKNKLTIASGVFGSATTGSTAAYITMKDEATLANFIVQTDLLFSYGTIVRTKKGIVTDLDIPYDGTELTMVIRKYRYLESLKIAEGYTNIPDYMVYNCLGLRNVQLPSTITSIGEYAFRDCPLLKQINLPEGLISIGLYSFNACPITGVSIPNSVTTIGNYAFNGCKTLADEITIPNSVTNMGMGVFQGCTSLIKATVLNNTISMSTFSGCTSLEEVNISNNVTTIDSSAFGACYALSKITIPDSVVSIGSSIFNNCTSLKEITIPESVTTLGTAIFNACTALERVTLPKDITAIPQGMFYACTALKEITIPDNVTAISTQVFYNCTNLRKYVFNCITVPTLAGTNAFSSIPADAKMYVRDELIDAWKAATNWSTYASYIVPLSTLEE